MNKRIQKKYYKKIIEDIAYEISIDHNWRKAIFQLEYNEPLFICLHSCIKLPKYLENIMLSSKIFQVKKVYDCPEKFDQHLIIFKFESVKYHDIVYYTGNNPNVI